MNRFGKIFNVGIYGESHGEEIGVVIDGVTPGIKIQTEDFLEALDKRKPGKLGTTKRIESDTPKIVSGIFDGYTTGAPININFKNLNKRSEDYPDLKSHPRPGHADYSSTIKYAGYNDIRGGGHFSGRMTLGLVAAGVVAEKHYPKNIEIEAKIIKLGKMVVQDIDDSEVRLEIERIALLGDSLGGVINCKIKGIMAGLGEPFFDSLESVIAHGIFSIPGVKGIEFGDGFKGCEKLGSEFNDVFINSNGETSTNSNGGINGGISNGNEISFNVAIKPTSTIFKIQESFNFKTGSKEKLEIKGRHDTAFVLRTPIIIESVAKIVMADMFLRK
ncbi:MAG: chorismate synthase [Fusobacteriaceae bacterium]